MKQNGRSSCSLRLSPAKAWRQGSCAVIVKSEQGRTRGWGQERYSGCVGCVIWLASGRVVSGIYIFTTWSKEIAGDIRDTFSQDLSVPISFAFIQKPVVAPQKVLKDGKSKTPALRSIEPPQGLGMNDCVLWYIGEEGRSCMNLQMTHANNPVSIPSTHYRYLLCLTTQQLFIYSPSSQSVSPLHRSTSRLLSRRLFALHQALSADVFGLIVSNIGLASSKPLLARLREDLKRAKKKSYTLSVGRLNPAKLANFAEIECFVLVGCAEGGVVDSKVCLFFLPYVGGC